MSDTKEDNEPSMEEILASIRKIISEDDAEGSPAEAPAPQAAAKQLDDDVLELTEPLDDPGAAEAKAKATPDPATPQPGKTPGPDSSEDSMEPAKQQEKIKNETVDKALSTTTESAVTSALASFTGQVAKDKQTTEPVPGGGLTLDVLVRETLTPYLKSWLDENLETVVERVVRDEVRRLARRAEDA